MKLKKLIAPAVITLLMAGYYIAIAVFGLLQAMPAIVKIIFIVVPLALCGVMIYVFIERIKEIRSGEEDDIGKY